MPYVDENSLHNCVKEYSGVSKLWEDIMHDPLLNNLRVSEVGLLSYQKNAEYNRLYNEQIFSVIKPPKTLVFTEK